MASVVPVNVTNQTISSKNKKNNMPVIISENISVQDKEHDKLRKTDLITKTKIGIDTALNTPGYAYRGMKGDPDFNFYEYLKVSKIPYYIGGLGLAGVCLAGKNKYSVADASANHRIFKKVLTGVLMYYIAKEVANAVIDIPVKLFRGIDLNMPYKKVTSLREGNPLNLPNNKKPSNQNVFESTEFTRWDLLYKHGPNTDMNENFDKIAKKFGAKEKLVDADSTLIPKIRELIIMASSWKYMLSAPFVILGLGLAQQESFENVDARSLYKNTINLFKPSTTNRFTKIGASIKTNLLQPVSNSFKELWKGKTLTSSILGKSAIIGTVGLTVLANIMILNKTSIKGQVENGGRK